MTFLLLSKVEKTRTKDLAGTTQIANNTTRPISVTDDGHVLLPGQVAAVSSDDQTLAKAINKGLVSAVGFSESGSSSTKSGKRGSSTLPKGRTSSKGTVARGKDE